MIYHKPYKLIWAFVPVTILVYLIELNNTIDIQLHDTYFIISIFHISIILALILAFLGLIYWLLRKIKLINWLTIIHVVSSIILPLALLFVFSNSPFNSSFNQNSTVFKLIMHISSFFIYIGVFSQLLFIINVVVSLFRNLPKSNYN